MIFNYPNSEKTFSVDNMLNEKIDFMCKRINDSNGDAVLIADGAEGSGKSNLLTVICYMFSKKLNRKYTVDNIYFNLDTMLKDIQSSEEGIFHFDEAALGAMANEWQNKLQKKFVKLLMIARKRKHVIVMAIPQFKRLNDYLAVDRSTALLHTYLKNGIYHGPFTYYTIAGKSVLYDLVKKKKTVQGYKFLFNGAKRNRGKYGCFKSRIDYHMEKLIDFSAYDKKKDEAINGLVEDSGTGETNIKENLFFRKYKKDIKNNCKQTQKEYADDFDCAERTVRRWIASPEWTKFNEESNITD